MKAASSPQDAPDEQGARARILAAATTEFARNGYHGTSLRSITTAASSNKPMVYYHFEGKAGLYTAAVRQTMDELNTKLDLQDGEGSALTRLERFCRVYLETFLRPESLARTVLRELESLPNDVTSAIFVDYEARVAQRLRSIIVSGIESREFRDLPPASCTSAIVGILHGAARARVADPATLLDSTLSQVIDVYARGLCLRGA